MKKMLKISIMIPAYNSAKTIRESIESAISQTCRHREIVVVDDGSTDDTVAIASEYPGVRVERNPENLGIGVMWSSSVGMTSSQTQTSATTSSRYSIKKPPSASSTGRTINS